MGTKPTQPTSHPTSGPDPTKIENGVVAYGPVYEIGYWDGFNDGVGMGRYIESLGPKNKRKRKGKGGKGRGGKRKGAGKKRAKRTP